MAGRYKRIKKSFQYIIYNTGLAPLLAADFEYKLSKTWKTMLEYQWINKIGSDTTEGSSLNTIHARLSYHW
ncbi:hypothetical protein [Iodobacter ciconiae]|uniref:hypothetical protein n=1 Tax=Iodobacter ciconiae TaxID=2496266 RepID=UPI0013DF5AFF